MPLIAKYYVPDSGCINPHVEALGSNPLLALFSSSDLYRSSHGSEGFYFQKKYLLSKYRLTAPLNPCRSVGKNLKGQSWQSPLLPELKTFSSKIITQHIPGQRYSRTCFQTPSLSQMTS